MAGGREGDGRQLRPLSPSCMRIACLFLLAAGLVPLQGTAQPIVGVVAEVGTGAPVPGAMVILFDSAGARVERKLTNGIGRFFVQARDPGPHYIAVERIGYASWTTDRFEPDDLDGLLTIQVPVEAVALEGLDVRAGRRCEVRPEEGKATARVWEEVRKALAAEEYTREASLYRYTLAMYDRRLDRNARKIIGEETRFLENRPAAFRSFPIEDLVTRGFVETFEDSVVYYAPDAGALLSDAFLDTHCFGLREGEEGDTGRIGLVFRPLDDRYVPDISGVLWVSATTSELERLEFAYRNLIRSREVGDAGGEVAFTRLPDGAWIVREWRLRMPQLKRRIFLRRTGYREEGGVVRAITDSRGRTILHTESASISGVVTDSAGTGPPSEILAVELVGTGLYTALGEDGSFLLTGLSADRHVLRVQRPLLANWGIASPSEAVVHGRLGQVAHLRLRSPSVADALAVACGGAPRPMGTASFLGRVTTTAGPPAADMTVVARWPLATGYSAAAVAAPLGPEGTPNRTWAFGRDGAFATATTTTDWRGMFLLCDVPSGSRLRISVRGPMGRDPVFTETYHVTPGVRAVVESLIVPPTPEPPDGQPTPTVPAHQADTLRQLPSQSVCSG